MRRIRADLLACIILTPLAIVITYVCLFSADYYNQRKFASIPAAKWTSVSLLVMISIMLFGYYIWVYVVVGYHGRTWYYWWQRECLVRYIPPNVPEEQNAHRESETNSVLSLSVEEKADDAVNARGANPSATVDVPEEAVESSV